MSSFAPLQPASEISAFKGRMNIPAVRERVGLTLGSGIYLVVAVNARKKIVDLISIEGTAYLLEKIPFSALRRMDDAAQMIFLQINPTKLKIDLLNADVPL